MHLYLSVHVSELLELKFKFLLVHVHIFQNFGKPDVFLRFGHLLNIFAKLSYLQALFFIQTLKVRIFIFQISYGLQICLILLF